jgi:hypothetical protein
MAMLGIGESVAVAGLCISAFFIHESRTHAEGRSAHSWIGVRWGRRTGYGAPGGPGPREGNEVESVPHHLLRMLPVEQVPNMRPAYWQLHALGFTRVRVLYIANNLGTDWVNKGYPVAKGR